jgi:hypothetical protein
MTPATCDRIGCQRHHQLKANGLDVCVLKLLIDQDGNETAQSARVFDISEKQCKILRKTTPDFEPTAKVNPKTDKQ